MVAQPVTLFDITFDPATASEDGGFGFKRIVRVNGVDYEWQHAFLVAALLDVQRTAQAAGGAVAQIATAVDITTTDADPGAGRMRFDTGVQNTAGHLYISTTDPDGADVSGLLAAFGSSTSAVKGFLRIGHRTDKSAWMILLLTGVVSATGYYKLAVTPVAWSVASPFAAGAPATLGFAPSGDKGDTGAGGANGAGPLPGGTVGGTANVITLTPTAALATYTTGVAYFFTAGATNTGATTVAVSGLAAKTIVRLDNAALTGGEIVSGSQYAIIYDGTSFRLLGLDAVTIRALTWGGAAGGTANALTLTPATAIGAYAAGQQFLFLASATNTGATTVAVSGLAAKAIVRRDGTALAGAEIVSGSVYQLVYDGTSFRLGSLDRAEIRALTWGGTVGGTGNAITLTPGWAISAYASGQRFQFVATATNTGAVTVAVSGLGTKAIVTAAGAALIGGEIASGTLYEITYDGTSFRMAGGGAGLDRFGDIDEALSYALALTY